MIPGLLQGGVIYLINVKTMKKIVAIAQFLAQTNHWTLAGTPGIENISTGRT